MNFQCNTLEWLCVVQYTGQNRLIEHKIRTHRPQGSMISSSNSSEEMRCVKDDSLWISDNDISHWLINPSLPSPLPGVLCPALTHDSPVCFIPCLADGPEISPEQKEGAVPTFSSHPSSPACVRLCSALCLSLCLSLYVTVLSSVHSDEFLAFSWIQQLV